MPDTGTLYKCYRSIEMRPLVLLEVLPQPVTEWDGRRKRLVDKGGSHRRMNGNLVPTHTKPRGEDAILTMRPPSVPCEEQCSMAGALLMPSKLCHGSSHPCRRVVPLSMKVESN